MSVGTLGTLGTLECKSLQYKDFSRVPEPASTGILETVGSQEFQEFQEFQSSVPGGILDGLEARGFTLAVSDGKLFVSPAGKLTAADRELIRSHRDALVAEVDLRELDRHVLWLMWSGAMDTKPIAFTRRRHD